MKFYEFAAGLWEEPEYALVLFEKRLKSKFFEFQEGFYEIRMFKLSFMKGSQKPEAELLQEWFMGK